MTNLPPVVRDVEEGKLERLTQAQKHNMAAVLSSQFHARLFPLL